MAVCRPFSAKCMKNLPKHMKNLPNNALTFKGKYIIIVGISAAACRAEQHRQYGHKRCVQAMGFDSMMPGAAGLFSAASSVTMQID